MHLSSRNHEECCLSTRSEAGLCLSISQLPFSSACASYLVSYGVGDQGQLRADSSLRKQTHASSPCAVCPSPRPAWCGWEATQGNATQAQAMAWAETKVGREPSELQEPSGAVTRAHPGHFTFESPGQQLRRHHNWSPLLWYRTQQLFVSICNRRNGFGNAQRQ